jgi:hypothetical protein
MLTPGDHIAFCPIPHGDPSSGETSYKFSEFTVE